MLEDAAEVVDMAETLPLPWKVAVWCVAAAFVLVEAIW